VKGALRGGRGAEEEDEGESECRMTEGTESTERDKNGDTGITE
jgi:hypothetical protein